MSTSPEFLDRTIQLRHEQTVFDWMDFDAVPIQLRLAVQRMVDEWESYAEDREIDIHTEIFNNFHPIIVSQGRVVGRPMVSWPISRIEMNTLAHLTSRSDARAVTNRVVDQTMGTWLTTVDRVVIADVTTDHSPTVMTVLENPFATHFRELIGSDFVQERQELLQRFFSWPSKEVPFHSSLVSFDTKDLEDMVKWIEILSK